MKIPSLKKLSRVLVLATLAVGSTASALAVTAPVFRPTPRFLPPVNYLTSPPSNSPSNPRSNPPLPNFVQNIQEGGENSAAVVTTTGNSTTIAAIKGTLVITLKDGTKKTINAGTGMVINEDGSQSTTASLSSLLQGDTSGTLKAALVEAVKDYATQVATSAATGTDAARNQDSLELAAVIKLVTQEAAKAGDTTLVTNVVQTAASTLTATTNTAGATATEVTNALAVVAEAAKEGATAGGANATVVASIATTVVSNSNGAVTATTLAQATSTAVTQVNTANTATTEVKLDAVEKSGS